MTVRTVLCGVGVLVLVLAFPATAAFAEVPGAAPRAPFAPPAAHAGLPTLTVPMRGPKWWAASDLSSAWLAADAVPPAKEAAKPAAGGSDGGDLAKASQNPISSLISLPFQSNTNFGVGPDDKVMEVLNIQPVVPVQPNCRWNLINRLVLPVVALEDGAVPGQDGEFGLGDAVYTAFFSPRTDSIVTWGVGPVFQIPTSTDDLLGTGRWAAGPSAVVVAMPGKWVLGALVNHLWSIDDADGPEVNQSLIQPFVNYNLPCGWNLSTSPIITANWEAPEGERWTVPIGGGFGRVTKLGRQPIAWGVHAYWNAEHPTLAGEWTLRLTLSFLFPRK